MRQTIGAAVICIMGILYLFIAICLNRSDLERYEAPVGRPIGPSLSPTTACQLSTQLKRLRDSRKTHEGLLDDA